MGKISEKVSKFYGGLEKNVDHRYKSWENCYNYFFQVHKGKRKLDIELASLHLAFYLASWGMYRASSFVLQKDYTIYKPVIKIIFDEKYALLWNINKNVEKENLQELFIDIYSQIEKELIKIKKTIKNHKDLKEDKFNLQIMSDILITKILLGTIGCIPAYDRFFKKGLRQEEIVANFNKNNSFNTMLNFYKNNLKEINNMASKYSYTPMKIIDMYFWILGYDEEQE